MCIKSDVAVCVCVCVCQARDGSAGPGELVLTRQAGLFHHVVQTQPSRKQPYCTPENRKFAIIYVARLSTSLPPSLTATTPLVFSLHLSKQMPQMSAVLWCAVLRGVSAWVLFNPGLGHPAQSQHWAQTLSLIPPAPSDATSPASQPILLTAHSARDCARDMHHLSSATEFGVEWLCMPGLNPFANRRRSLDPLDRTHVVAANHSAGLMQLRGRSPT